MDTSEIFIKIVRRKLKSYKPDKFIETEFDKLGLDKQVQVSEMLICTYKPDIKDNDRISLIWERYQFLLNKHTFIKPKKMKRLRNEKLRRVY